MSSQNTIANAMTTNYIFNHLVTTLVLDKNYTAQGLYPNMPVIASSKNTDYIDFVANGFKYVFIFEHDLNDLLENSFDSIKRAKLISYDPVAINYFTPLINADKSVLTFGQILSNPLLNTKRPIQNHVSGANLGDWTTSVVNALRTIISHCPYDMDTVGEYQPRFFVPTYQILSASENIQTKKTSIIMFMKYKTAAGVWKVLHMGGGLQQIIVNSTTYSETL